MGRRNDQPTGADSQRTEPSGSDSMTEVVGRLDTVEPGNLTDVLGIGPEECLYQLVEEHDGRLAQERLVELVPWSAATVSRLLSALEEQQRVVRIHAGRGKVVFLSEQSPAP
jgi:hypothetical protein